ncbi:MAG: DNA alkylation repair protein [Phycisphaerales bacterium JB063]
MSEVEEVYRRLVDLAGGPARTNAQIRREYHGSSIPHLGLTLPTQRRALKQGYSFSGLPAKQQVKRWDGVWREASWFETMSQAALWLSMLRDPADLLACWPTAKGWIEQCDNWAHSDLLSSAYTRMLEADTERAKVYPTLVKWNTSQNPWHRRQSIVSLIYYHTPRRAAPRPSEVLPLVESLLHDEDVYVQKGVGWTLRESYNAFPKQAGPFIDKHATALSSIAYSAATEKHPKAHKDKLKAVRKAHRQANRG